VTDSSGATPLPQVTVEVYDAGGALIKTSSTNGSGEYTVDGLLNAYYTLVARAEAGNYGAILYADLNCDGGCDPTVAGATRVSVGDIANFSLPDDNCPNVDNPDQADADGDGRGDQCELPVVDQRADVDPSASIGVGSRISRGADVDENARIGDQVMISRDAEIGARCRIGDRVTLGQGNVIGADCEIGDDTSLDRNGTFGINLTIGSNSIIGQRVEAGNNVTIGNDVDLGRDVFIGDGVCIPDGSSYRGGTIITDTTLCD